MPARKKTTRLTPVGKKIKKARTDKKMSYESLANDTGFSVDFLKKVESGKVTPPVGSLLQISRALEIDSGDLLKEEEDRMQDRIKAYTKRTASYAYTTLTPGAENKHLKAFKVEVGRQERPRRPSATTMREKSSYTCFRATSKWWWANM